MQSAGKVMATVFWGHTRNLGKGLTTCGEYYASLLEFSGQEIKRNIFTFGQEERALPSRQCSGAQLCGFDVENGVIEAGNVHPIDRIFDFVPILKILF